MPTMCIVEKTLFFASGNSLMGNKDRFQWQKHFLINLQFFPLRKDSCASVIYVYKQVIFYINKYKLPFQLRTNVKQSLTSQLPSHSLMCTERGQLTVKSHKLVILFYRITVTKCLWNILVRRNDQDMRLHLFHIDVKKKLTGFRTNKV